MNSLRAAVIGLGRIGTTLEDDPKRIHPCTHAGALKSLPGAELVSGAARSNASAERFKERWGLQNVYTDYREMIQKENLDIIGIATNPETHAEIVEAIAPMGIKGILCEKPLALSLEESDRMIEACNKHGVVLMTMHNRRFNSIYRSAKQLIADGSIGKVNAVIGICQGCKPDKNWQNDFEGPLLHDATHLFDIMRYLFGDVQWIQSDVERANPEDKVEDSAYSTMRFKNGIYGMTLVNERTDYMRFELEIQGSKGKLLLLTNEAYMWTYTDSQYASGFRELKQTEYPAASYPLNAYLEGYKELIECIKTGDFINNSSTSVDGRAALEIIMGIYESKRHDCKKIYMPLPSMPSSLLAATEEHAF